MLESFLQEPERLTDDDVMLLLKLIFHRQDTQELLKKLLEREKPETLSLLRAQLSPPEVGALRSRSSSPEGCDFPQSWSAPNHTGDATLPLRYFTSYPFVDLHLGTALQAVPSRQVEVISGFLRSCMILLFYNFENSWIITN